MCEILKNIIHQIPMVIGRAMDGKPPQDPNVSPDNLLEQSYLYSVEGRKVQKSPFELSEFPEVANDPEIAESDQSPTDASLTLEE